MGCGGKGANQAVMAAKLGADVSIITKLGRDLFGEMTLSNYKDCGVNTQYVYFTEQAFSGVAPITVDSEGRNSILIVTGANDLLTQEEIENARPAIAASHVLICQMEIPLGLSRAALRIAREEGVLTLFNPAPALPDLPEEFYGLSDIFCPNETETELLTGKPVTTISEAESAARDLLDRGAGKVILTLGERGSLLVTRDEVVHVPGEKTTAVDTTGAGDCYLGSLAYFLARGISLTEAMKKAGRVASLSVQRAGTQSSYPTAGALPSALFADCGG
jgi:ribokinase